MALFRFENKTGRFGAKSGRLSPDEGHGGSWLMLLYLLSPVSLFGVVVVKCFT